MTNTEEKTYIMRINENRCSMRYLFKVDDTEKIIHVETMPIMGIEHTVYERASDNNSSLKSWKRTQVIAPVPERFKGGECGSDTEKELLKYLGSEENIKRSHWEESEPALIDRLRLGDPIVRDAFNPGMTAGDLFKEYCLIPVSGDAPRYSQEMRK